MEFPESHKITFHSCHEIQQICKQFFEETGLSYFNFVRAYDDGSRICLANNLGWMRFVFHNHQKCEFAFEETDTYIVDNFIVWDNIPGLRDDRLIKIAREQYNIDHGLTIVLKYSHYAEFYYFATHPDNIEVNNFYVNNLDILKSFIQYFKDKAYHIIQQADEERIEFEGHSFFWLDDNNQKNKKRRSEILRTIPTGRYFLSNELYNVYFTQREAQCVHYLACGKRPKDIARILRISHRTVEGHINNVKNKLNCNCQGEILKIAKANGFEQIQVSIRAMEECIEC